MLLRALSRLLLVAALVLAVQSTLEHPFKHVGQGLAHSEQCDACIAHAALGAAAHSHASIAIPVSLRGLSETARPVLHLAAFTPPFRSQAPPAVL